MTDLAVIAGVLLALGCFALAAAHSWTVGRLTFLDWSVLAVGGVYGLGWVLVVLVTRSGGNPDWESWLLSSKGYFLLHTACVLVVVSGIVVGWLVGVRTTLSANTTAMRHGLGAGRRSAEIISAWLMLILAFLTQLLYVQDYGGFLDALGYSAAVRSGIFTTDNRWSFLFPFGSLAFISSFIFYGLLLSSPRQPGLLVSLALSVLASLYVLLSHLGRLEALIYLATFIFGYLSFKVRSPLALVAISGLGGVAILSGAYWLSFATGIKFTEGVDSFLAKELAFPFVSFFEHVAAGTAFRWFYDILVMPVFILPQSFWIDWVEDLSQVNTALILGAPKGLGGVTGAIPVDLVTLGLLQASVPGVFTVGVLFGILLSVLDRLVAGIQHLGVRSVVVTYLAFKVAFLGVFYAEPAMLVKGNIQLIAAAIIYACCRVIVTSSARPVIAAR